MPHGWLLIVVMGACLAISFFLSGMEAGLFALSRLRIRQRAREGDTRAVWLLRYLEHPEDFFWTILVGSTLANFCLVALGVVGLHAWLGERPLVLVGLFVLFLLLVYGLGDLLPKLLFQMVPNRLCLALARPFGWLHLGLAPCVWLVTLGSRWLLRWTGGQAFQGRLFGNREEMRLVMRESASGLSTDERAMIDRVLDLEHLRLSQLLVPMETVVTVTMETPMQTALELCQTRGFTRLPVWDSSQAERRVAGLLSLNSLLYRADLRLDRPASDYVKSALYLEEHVRLEVALRRMQRSGQRLAIVLDLQRRELGIVCLQDLFKAMFGEVSL